MTTSKVCLYTKTLVLIHLKANARYAARVSITRINHRKMGNDLVIKCISTGTVTRMDLDKASLKFLSLQVFLMNIVCSLLYQWNVFSSTKQVLLYLL